MPHLIRTDLTLIMARVLVLAMLIVCGNGQPADMKTPISYNLTEERAYGSFVGNILMDGGLRNKYSPSVLASLRFSLLEQDLLAEGLFSIDETEGVLRVARRLDRDELCPSAEACLLSLDVQVMPLDYFEIIKVTVNLLDINDHIPTFPTDTVIRKLSEASVVGPSLSIPLPHDPDSPKFGVHHYKLISSSDTFELQTAEEPGSEEDIYVVLRKPLDREQQDAYMVQLVAFDGGQPPQWGSVMVNISIIDVNDNTPTFQKETYETSIPENSPKGSVILRVIAEDRDTGPQGTVVYMFSQKTFSAYQDIFQINETTGEIIAIGKLDYERKSLYKLSVIARDNSSQALSTQTLVTIHILDMNDHPPQIKVNPQNASNLIISENYTPGDFVAHLSVVDLDDGKNGQFNCSVNSKTFKLLKLYETEFKLVTATELNREVHDTYILPIICVDLGSPSLHSEMDLIINIMDENDNPPVFEKDIYHANISEGSSPGSFITNVRATDADLSDNGRVRYALADDTNGLFQLDSNSGDLMTNISLDYEKMSQVNVSIIARDSGQPQQSATTTVHINVIDVDDEPLLFSQTNYVFSVLENEKSSSPIGQVKAIDADSPQYTIMYSFKDDQDLINWLFSIDSISGAMFCLTDLDHDVMPVYDMTIIATVEEQNTTVATALVTVIVGDVNDNSPLFVYPTPENDTVYIDGHIQVNQTITRVTVEDADSGNNAQFSFAITASNGSDVFSIGEDTGDIISNQKLTVTEIVYWLDIIVSDNGSPSLSSKTTLFIHIDNLEALGVTGSGNNQTIVVSIACVSGIVVVILIVAIVLIIRRQCKTKRKQQRVIIKFSADNPICVASLVDEEGKKTDSFSSRDSGHGSGSSKDAEMESSHSPGSSLEHDSDLEDSASGQSSLEENSRPLFLQIPNAECTLLNPVRLDCKDSDSGCSTDLSNGADSGRGSSSSHNNDNMYTIDMMPDPCFFTEGSRWPPSGGLLQTASTQHVQKQLCGGVSRSHSYMGAVTPVPAEGRYMPRRPASFVVPHNKQADHSELYGHSHFTPIVDGRSQRIAANNSSFSHDPRVKPTHQGQNYRQILPSETNLPYPSSNMHEGHLAKPHTLCLQQTPSSKEFWDILEGDLQVLQGQKQFDSLPSYLPTTFSCQEGTLSDSLDRKTLAASLHTTVPILQKENSSILKENSILKDTSPDTTSSEDKTQSSAKSKASRHGNHVRFRLPDEDIQEDTVVTLSCEPSAKRVYLCSEV